MDKSVEKELIHLETRYWEAMKKKDFEAALSLADDPCVVVGPSGVAHLTKDDFRRMMKAEPYILRDFQLKDPTVRMLAEGFAVVAYTAHEEFTVDGQPVSMDAAHSSTRTKKKGKWVCAAHTESLAGDPFGRDRKAA